MADFIHSDLGKARHALQFVSFPASALRPLPPIQQNTPQLRAIAENLAEIAPSGGDNDEVVHQSPSLADKVGLRTADYTIEEIATEITSVIRQSHDDTKA